MSVVKRMRVGAYIDIEYNEGDDSESHQDVAADLHSVAKVVAKGTTVGKVVHCNWHRKEMTEDWVPKE